MLTLPDAILPVLHPFATLFRNPTWLKAQILLVGAILAPGQRTVAAALRVMGRSDHRDYARYHEVLNRAVWSPRQAARIPVAANPAPGSRRWPVGLRHRRNPGTAPRPQNQIPGHLPRCGAFQPEPPGPGQWPALDLPDVAGPGPLGGTLLGLALPHRAGALGTLPTGSADAATKSSPTGPAR